MTKEHYRAIYENGNPQILAVMIESKTDKFLEILRKGTSGKSYHTKPITPEEMKRVNKDLSDSLD